VLGLYDLAAAPWFRTAAARAYIDKLTTAYNTSLSQELEIGTDDGVHLVDTAALLAPIIDDPAAYGFSHGRGVDACASNGADALDFCDPATQRSSTSHRDCVFAASVHLTTAAHELLGHHVVAATSVRLAKRPR
jgi:phospholipase/lecithinase/hemolysin